MFVNYVRLKPSYISEGHIVGCVCVCVCVCVCSMGICKQACKVSYL